jgi:phosphohistidine phosphatase
MKLYLIQHAEAKAKQEDPNRGLTDEGRNAIHKTGAFFASIKPEVAEIRYSTKLRARETALILAEHMQRTDITKQYEGITPNDSVEPLVRELKTTDNSLVIVGHLPYLGKLASRLLCGDETIQPLLFHNAGIVCFMKTDGHWQVEWIVPPWLL